jgi:PIN domain nuclease of toxin-antitoxin system
VTLLLDTHVVLWRALSQASIGRESGAVLEQAERAGTLCVSAVTFWEIALLCQKGRLTLHAPPEEIRRKVLGAGVTEIPLTGDIAVLATQLDLHGDPADRFIAASAIASNATLLTADERLLAFAHSLARQDARL